MRKTKVKENKRDYSLIVLNLVKNHANKTIFACLILLFLGIFIGSKNQVNSNPFEYFSHSTKLWQANQFMLKNYKGFNRLEIILDSGVDQGVHNPKFLEKVNQLNEWIVNKEYTNRTFSMLDHYKQLNRAFHYGEQKYFTYPKDKLLAAQQFLFYTMGLPQGMDVNDMIDLGQRHMRFTILWNIQASKYSVEQTKLILNKAKQLGLNATATGQEYLFQKMNKYVVEGYFTSIAISLVLISLLMIFVFRSIKIGLLSVVPNLFPIIMGAMAMAITGRPIDVGTVLVASVCFGIAVDDTIHFLNEYLIHRRSGLAYEQALNLTLNHTGRALCFTTFVLAGGFGVFYFADFVPNFNFGVFTALVLIVALIADVTLLPSLLKKIKI